jgi:hypothetical protein
MVQFEYGGLVCNQHRLGVLRGRRLGYRQFSGEIFARRSRFQRLGLDLHGHLAAAKLTGGHRGNAGSVNTLAVADRRLNRARLL